jgi:hypothetical protein
MSQCLRCSKPCAPTSVFCEECRSLLRNQLQQEPVSHGVNSLEEPLAVASSLPEYAAGNDEKGQQESSQEPITGPQPITPNPQTPYPPSLSSYANIDDQTISKLNEAAQRIAEAEPGKGERKGRLYPRPSRLAPMRDISADIQRASTPLPKVSESAEDAAASKEPSSNGTLPVSNKSQSDDTQVHASAPAAGRAAKDADLPDLWPWLDTELEDKEVDNWADQTDPLLSRHIPNSAESARIEEEDMRRAAAEGITTAPFPTYRRPRQSPRLRGAFIALAIFAVLAMIADGILLSLALGHAHHTDNASAGPPALTLSSHQANSGETLKLVISHFTPATSVLLTHDIQEAVQTTSNSAIIPIDSQGNATASIIIDNTWGPGLHLLFAEDILTRYTASATLQITNGGISRPPRLDIQEKSIDLGPAVQGANTIHHLTLLNDGDGSISWAASSNSPWLQVSPLQGVFSKSQTIVIAAQRAGLKPRDYSGTITFSSNVGTSQVLHVQMTVRPLQPNAGPVLSLTPAVLSFTTADGNAQTLTQVLTISNPGSQTLNWSVSVSDPASQSNQNSLFHMPGAKSDWLSTDLASGTIWAGSSEPIQVKVQSSSLLPGTYLGTLVFSGRGAVDNPQSVSISLTVQPHCGLIISPGGLSFTTVQGQGNPSNQTLNVSLTTSCDGSTVTWHAVPSTGWLTAAPTSGQLRGAMSTVTSVGVNISGLAPGTYNGAVSFVVVGQSTQTVAVQLIVQPAPPPAEPIMSASPLNLNFSNTQGQPNPSGQVVTITNNGNGPLKWRTTVNQLASGWLGAAPTGGTVNLKQTGQVTISVDTSTLTPGTYVGQVILDGTDINGHEASGSPQTVTVNLVVQPPCVLTQPSSSALTFTYTQGGSAPSPQNVMFTSTGSCAWPLTWNTTITPPSSSWLALALPSGSIKASGESASIQVSVNTANLQPGTYTAQVHIGATDSSGASAQGSPRVFSVTLTVIQPCSLQQLPPSLAFSAVEGQPPPASQNFIISEAGGCSYPVSWTAVGDPNSSAWLGITPTNGSDHSSGSTVIVSVTQTNMTPGTYTGQITVSATDSNGVVVQGTPQTIPVTLTITASI